MKHMKQLHFSRSRAARTTAVATFLAVAVVGVSAATAQPTGKPRTMDPSELIALYSDKTWMWERGGGYMAPGGDFTGYVAGQNRDESTYATGKWWTTDQGVMCFRATWHVRSSGKLDEKCFGHRTDGDVIFQRVEPNGFWYVFRTQMAPHPKDEFAKLRSGDRVSIRARWLQATFARQSPPTRQQ